MLIKDCVVKRLHSGNIDVSNGYYPGENKRVLRIKRDYLNSRYRHKAEAPWEKGQFLSPPKLDSRMWYVLCTPSVWVTNSLTKAMFSMISEALTDLDVNLDPQMGKGT